MIIFTKTDGNVRKDYKNEIIERSSKYMSLVIENKNDYKKQDNKT
jgi:hypothetical protein